MVTTMVIYMTIAPTFVVGTLFYVPVYILLVLSRYKQLLEILLPHRDESEMETDLFHYQRLVNSLLIMIMCARILYRTDVENFLERYH
jgi:hypothetical protein